MPVIRMNPQRAAPEHDATYRTERTRGVGRYMARMRLVFLAAKKQADIVFQRRIRPVIDTGSPGKHNFSRLIFARQPE